MLKGPVAVCWMCRVYVVSERAVSWSGRSLLTRQARVCRVFTDAVSPSFLLSKYVPKWCNSSIPLLLSLVMIGYVGLRSVGAIRSSAPLYVERSKTFEEN